jgi:hypothetical protein
MSTLKAKKKNDSNPVEEGAIFFETKDERDVYEGEMVDGIPHGKGKMTYKKGTVVEGIFENGNLKEMISEKKFVIKQPDDRQLEKVKSNKKSSVEPESNLFRNIAIGTAGLGIAGISYYMLNRKKSRRKSVSSSAVNRPSKHRRRSKRRNKNKISL